jgi:hypothetical protein
MHRLLIAGSLLFLLRAADKPAPAAEVQASMIAAFRQRAAAYDQSLADFLCTQSTNRYTAAPVSSGEPEWKSQDTFTARITYFKRRESYRVILQNGKTVDKPIDKLGGHRTEGEFGTFLNDIVSDGNQARFTWKQWSVRDGSPLAVFSFHIDRAHSSFQTTARRMFRTSRCKWGAEGVLEVNPATSEVMALTLHAVDIPADCALKDLHIAIEYGYRKVGEREFLLPVASESRINIFGELVRAESKFTDYRKFSSESDIRFESPAASMGQPAPQRHPSLAQHLEALGGFSVAAAGGEVEQPGGFVPVLFDSFS